MHLLLVPECLFTILRWRNLQFTLIKRSNDIALNEGKKVLTADHILRALEDTDFDFGEKLRAILEEFRAEQKEKKSKKAENPGKQEENVDQPDVDDNENENSKSTTSMLVDEAPKSVETPVA
jgi:hypothetical protein